ASGRRGAGQSEKVAGLVRRHAAKTRCLSRLFGNATCTEVGEMFGTEGAGAHRWPPVLSPSGGSAGRIWALTYARTSPGRNRSSAPTRTNGISRASANLYAVDFEIRSAAARSVGVNNGASAPPVASTSRSLAPCFVLCAMSTVPLQFAVGGGFASRTGVTFTARLVSLS